MPYQVALTVVAPVRAGAVDDLKHLLATMGGGVANGSVIDFGVLTGVHFARLILVGEDRDHSDAPLPASLPVQASAPDQRRADRKVHTVEWTPAVISHPTKVALRANWSGLAGERLHHLFGRLSSSFQTSTPSAPRPTARRSARPVPRDRGRAPTQVMDEIAMTDLLYSFGTLHPGVVVLHNFPRFLQEFERPDGHFQDLAATDILRSRELGLPRYNDFRRLLHLRRSRSRS
jgi:Animal haem peroxidase